MTEYRDMLIDVWIDASVLNDDGEDQPDWVYTHMHEIEKAIGKDVLDLAYERYTKRDASHLYKGAKVRSKRRVPYSELFNDPQDTYRDDEGSLALDADLKGEIVEDYIDHEIDPEGYFDCSVLFETSESGLPLLCRVEWLEWEDDQDEA